MSEANVVVPTPDSIGEKPASTMPDVTADRPITSTASTSAPITPSDATAVKPGNAELNSTSNVAGIKPTDAELNTPPDTTVKPVSPELNTPPDATAIKPVDAGLNTQTEEVTAVKPVEVDSGTPPDVAATKPIDAGGGTPSDATTVKPADPASKTPIEATTVKSTDAIPETTADSTSVQPVDTSSHKDVSGDNAKPKDETVSLSLTIVDFRGKPISGLKYQVIIGKTIYAGATDGNGCAADISGLLPNQPMEILVRKDNGEFSSKFKGLTSCSDMNVCAVSPHIKIEIESEPHQGSPAPKAAKPDKPLPSSSPPAPPAGSIASGGKHTDTTTQACRNDAGHPTATLKEKAADWAHRFHLPTFGLWSWDDFKPGAKACTKPAVAAPTAPVKPADNAKSNSTNPATSPTPAASKDGGPVKVGSTDQPVPKEVTGLVAIMEEQATWDWNSMFKEKMNSAAIKAAILAKTFTPTTGKDVTKSHGRCYPSVKVGLWRAGLVSGFYADIPAKGAGHWLLEQGFKDVTNIVPDGRWALPGDVIVYRYTDEREKENAEKHAAALKKYEADKVSYDAEKAAYPAKLSLWQDETKKAEQEKADAKNNKKKYTGKGVSKKPSLRVEPALPDDGNYGHIDVRTYDGYISDFKSERLPNISSKTPMVVSGIYRKVYDPLPDLRVRAFLKILREWECHGVAEDKNRYFVLQQNIDGKSTFTNTSSHPRAGIGGSNTFAGAYQISLGTYQEQVKKGLPEDFSPASQDRLAVSIIEGRAGNPLGKIRQGEILDAVHLLTNEWTSLPGGRDARHEVREKKNYVYTTADLMQKYNIFLNELIGK